MAISIPHSLGPDSGLVNHIPLANHAGNIGFQFVADAMAFVREAKRRGFKITERCGPAGIIEEAYALMG